MQVPPPKPDNNQTYRRGRYRGGEGAAGDLDSLGLMTSTVAQLEASPVVGVRHLEGPEGGGGAEVAAGGGHGGLHAVHDRSQDLQEALPHRALQALQRVGNMASLFWMEINAWCMLHVLFKCLIRENT